MSSKQAVLVIDMLNDFITGELKCERAGKIVPVLQRLLAAARAAGVPVTYCCDAHLPADFELRVWGQHAMADTPGAEVIPELKPQAGDYRLPKRTYSAFHETGLEALLRGLDVDTVLVTGIHTNICDRHTCADAFFRGFKIIVVTDGTEAFTAVEQEAGLAYLEKMYGATLMSTDNLLAEWREASTMAAE
ncbi:MAG: cysteine hydrolase family protein [Acidobacteriota bacterium]